MSVRNIDIDEKRKKEKIEGIQEVRKEGEKKVNGVRKKERKKERKKKRKKEREIIQYTID